MTAPLQGTKERILDLLRLAPLTAEEVAGALGLSRPAVLKHLKDLEARGLVRSGLRPRGGRGRPRRVYWAQDGEAPYAALCVELLQGLEAALGRAGLVGFLKERYLKALKGLGLLDKPLKEKLALLARFLKEQGYEAEVEEEEGRFYLVQRRCPRLALSQKTEALCEGELLAYQEALGLPLVREERLAEGGSCCRYRVE